MNRFVLRIVMAFVLSAFAVLGFAAPTTPTPTPSKEKEAVVQWVQDNAQTKLSEAKAIAIVRTAYLYAFRRELDPLLILSVIRTESGFIETARSGAGAKGLMQVIPYWHRDKLKGRDPYDRTVSIEVGSQILRDCLDKHANVMRRALACYSGGAKFYHKKVISHRTAIQRTLLQAQLRKPSRHASFIETDLLVSVLQSPPTAACKSFLVTPWPQTTLTDSFALTGALTDFDTPPSTGIACRWDEPSAPSA